MDCDQALLLISMKIDGELNEQESLELDAHLAVCPACRALLADFETMHEAMPAPVEVPADLKDKIMEQVRQSKVVPMAAPKKRVRWKPLVSIAAVLVLVLLGAGSLRYLPMGGMSGGAAPEAQSAAGASTPMTVELPPSAENFIAGESSNSGNSADNKYAADIEPSATSLPEAAPQEGYMGLARAYANESGLTGPWCGVLIVPADCLPDWSERTDFIPLDDLRCYTVSAAEFASLTAQAATWDGAETQTDGEYISTDAARGLVILTGFTAE